MAWARQGETARTFHGERTHLTEPGRERWQ